MTVIILGTLLSIQRALIAIDSVVFIDLFTGNVASDIFCGWYKFNGTFRSGRRDGAALSHFDILKNPH